MVFSLIFAAGALWALAVLIDYLNKPKASDVLADIHAQWDVIAAQREADLQASEPERMAAIDAWLDAVGEEHRNEVQARYKSLKKAKARNAAKAASKTTTDYSKDVTAALVSMGWPRADCKTLAENAVTTLGPTASIEELTIYALTHKP